MNKSEVYAYLRSRNIWFEVTEHEAVYNMEQMAAVPLPYPEADGKNLFVRDAKKRKYYLIAVRGNKRVDLKEFRQKHGTCSLSFASETELMVLLGLTPGAVTPLGVLNDTQRMVAVYLDRAFLEPPGLIGLHPNDNTATLWLKTTDLISIIQAHGNMLHLVDL